MKLMHKGKRMHEKGAATQSQNGKFAPRSVVGTAKRSGRQVFSTRRKPLHSDRIE
jgi:hypothetical protein